jgi:hypothetical protein
MDETERQAHIAARIATIDRAIAFIEETGDGCKHILRQTTIHQELQDNPSLLIERMRAMVEAGHTFGPWKAAQIICQAAGLDY